MCVWCALKLAPYYTQATQRSVLYGFPYKRTSNAAASEIPLHNIAFTSSSNVLWWLSGVVKALVVVDVALSLRHKSARSQIVTLFMLHLA